MKRDSNLYIFLYSSVLVVIVAVLLALAATALRPAQLENVRMEKRLDILKSIGIGLDADGADDKPAYISSLYDKYIVREHVVGPNGLPISGCQAFDLDLRGELVCPAETRRLPIFEAKLPSGETKYIFPLSGQGLWGPIAGYLALNADLNTVYGVSFSHKGETPGLGAEIAEPFFCDRFKGKQIFDGSKLVSISVLKTQGNESNPHAVDGISGGTMTSKGVEKMLLNCLEEYSKFIEIQKKEVLGHE